MMGDGKPFVPLEVVEFLEDTYKLPNMMRRPSECTTNEEHLGYLKGVSEVIMHLKVLAKRKDG